ncbi:MAG: hypothetical protein E6109_15955, partial [Ruminococcus sp.]|nr:hypothetical protein [Ruminococcus sp.]
MVYVRADNRLKNDAINTLAPKVTDEMNLPDWNKDRDLLQFLNSLTPVYNFINDRLVDESAVLRPLSWHLILYVFRY